MKLWYILLPTLILLFMVAYYVEYGGKLGTVKTATGNIITKWKINPPTWQTIKRVLFVCLIAFFFWRLYTYRKVQTMYFKKGQDYRTVVFDLRKFHWEVQGGVLCGFNGNGEPVTLDDGYQNFYGPQWRVMKLKVKSGDDVVMTVTYDNLWWH